MVQIFGAAHPHHAYSFANRRASRLKVLVPARSEPANCELLRPLWQQQYRVCTYFGLSFHME